MAYTNLDNFQHTLATAMDKVQGTIAESFDKVFGQFENKTPIQLAVPNSHLIPTHIFRTLVHLHLKSKQSKMDLFPALLLRHLSI